MTEKKSENIQLKDLIEEIEIISNPLLYPNHKIKKEKIIRYKKFKKWAESIVNSTTNYMSPCSCGEKECFYCHGFIDRIKWFFSNLLESIEKDLKSKKHRPKKHRHYYAQCNKCGQRYDILPHLQETLPRPCKCGGTIKRKYSLEDYPDEQA